MGVGAGGGEGRWGRSRENGGKGMGRAEAGKDVKGHGCCCLAEITGRRVHRMQ